MPSGKIHDIVTVISVIPAFLVGHSVFKFNQGELFVFIVALIFSQIMFGPDLDAQSSQYKRWGIIRWIWLPYRKIFKHRSRFSHGMLFGPIFRCIYFFIACILLFNLFRIASNMLLGVDFIYSMPRLGSFLLYVVMIDFNHYLIPLMAGLFTGAAIHTFTDKVFSFFKNLI